jgi:hypothetical protein
MSKEVRVGSGITFPGALALIFVVLKLTGHITWSWWWVLSPIWISWAIFLIIIGVIFGFALLAQILK